MIYHLFYLVGIPFLIRELIDLIQPIQYINKMNTIYKMADKKNEPKAYEYLTIDEKSALWYSVFSYIYVLWMMVGLFTSEWIIFLTFLIFSFLIYYPIIKLIRTKLGVGKAYITAHIIATIIDICIILFAIINHYHLHINLINLFLK